MIDSKEKGIKKNIKKLVTIKFFKRHNYKIWWLVVPIMILFLIIISSLRFTLFGVISDDVLSFFFGIDRYLIYFFIIIYSIIFLFGYRIHFYKKGSFLIILLFFSILLITSNIIILFFITKHLDPLWKSNYYKTIISKYWDFWHTNSIFSSTIDPSNLLYKLPDNFWYLGGGIIGFSLSSPFLMLSFPFCFLLSIIFFITIILFMFGIFNFKFKYNSKKNNEKFEKQIIPESLKVEPTLEELKQQKDEENLKNYYQKLNNSKIIDSSFLLDNDNENLDIKNEILISNIPRINKKVESILDELLNIKNYSTYIVDDFSIKNPTNDFNNKKNLSEEYFDNKYTNENTSFNEDSNITNESEIIDNEDELKNPDYEDENNLMNNDIQSEDFDSEDIEPSVDLIDDDFYNEDIDDINDDTKIKDNTHSDHKMNNYIENDLIYYNHRNNYILPDYSLLNTEDIDNNTNSINWENANILAKKIMNVFKQFHVQASIQSTNVGPQVTKFEIMPEPGTKVKKIISLESDLKLALATNSLRIEAPIQGKSFIGLEIPNKQISTISFNSIIKNIPNSLKKEKLLFGLGKTVDNKFMYLKLNELPHLLISGTTGSGKSVCIKSIVTSLIMQANPNELKFLLIDLKRVELRIFSKLPHLLSPIIYEHQKALSSLKIMTKEMENRYNLFSEYNINNIDSYNEISKNKLPKIVIIIDELADLMIGSKIDVEEQIIRLVQMSRAAGIYLIIATQRPSTDVVTGLIKTNISSRISFYLNSSIDSRTILDSSGAEKLISKGDMLYKGLSSNYLIRLQGIYILDEEIKRIVKHWQNQNEPIFDKKFISLISDHNYSTNSNKISNYKDPMYDEVKKFVIKNKKASVSLLQRYFSIGYIRASKIIDMLEIEKIIGPQNGSKPRDMFIDN